MAESSSSSPNLKWIYDVFLSFRGEDTRSNFTSHLDMALRQKGVNFFIDDKLDRGSQISKSLLKSIEGSRISIIIFSQNYASSTWCLDEVVKIIECMKSKGQLVLPVFYKVDPSEVRKQTGRFGEEMLKHEAKFMSTKIQTWKKALTIAAGLSGWDLATYRKETDLIQNLVKKVLSKVNRTQLLDLAKNPVGIDSQLRAIELASHDVSNGVYMVGLYGMGGIGKTTLAKALHNKISNQFEGCSFLSNVRETSEQFNGLVQLQKNLLCAILKDDLKVDNVDGGINIIRNRLCSKKVLIVLDDVDKLDQLEKLVGGRDWFGRGSKIIVTTRNKQLLSSHGFDKMHNIQGLDQDEALELYSWHAFKESHPSTNYLDLSKRATSYCKGLPLALVVLGSFLCNRDRSKWRSILYEFENSLTKDIKDILQISFNGLEDKVKDIFLDISCFFVGKHVNSIKDMLEACHLNPDYGITILMDLSLLTIENGWSLQMHDLIRQMGQTIVCRESSEPEKRSRLWVTEEIINMLRENSGTDAVKAIKLDLPYYRHNIVQEWEPIDPKAFRNMKNLRFLILGNTVFSGNIFEYLPNKLKGIYCHGLRIEQEMRNSHNVEHLGNRFENYWKRLKHVYLNFCYSEEILDFSAALNLEKLCLRWCRSLKMIHESVGSLSKLITLDLQGCVNLENLPSYFMLKSLEVLNLTDCKKLEEIPNLSASSNLKELYLGGCSNLRIIHESVGFLSKLITLDLQGCVNLENLPSYFMLKSLEVLNLTGCIKLEEIPDLSLSSNLKELYFRGCSYLRIIHESIGSLSKLITFDLQDCVNLENLPSYFMLKSLEVLNLTGCIKLEEIPDLSASSNLKELYLRGCSNLRIIHEFVGSLSKLITLDLQGCDNLENLPTYFMSKSLEVLNLTGCKKLEEIPDLSVASNLKELYLRGCSNLKIIHESVGSLSKLIITLDLQGCDNLENLPTYFTSKSLEVLNLTGCKKLEKIPDLSVASNLKQLFLKECSNLKIIHESAGPSLDKLAVLDLSHSCNLERLPSYVMSESLEVLNLAYCLKIENLSYVSLDKFPSDFKLKHRPKVLKLRGLKNLEEITGFSIASNLKMLNLSGCINLRTVHESIGYLDKLITLNLGFCSNLGKLPTYLRLKSLEFLNLENCKKLEQLPEFDENMKSLREMRLDETSIKELPPTIGYLIGLENLRLVGWINLTALPSEIHLLKSLEDVCLLGCSKLDMFPQRSSLNFPQESLCFKLIILDLTNCNISNTDFLETLSNVSTSLCELNLSGNKFSCLPSLQSFLSLQFLQLINCKFLRNIANLPTGRLERVDARGCELLVISRDYIADMISSQYEGNLGWNGSRELVVMRGEIPNYLNNQTTKSSISFSIEENPNKEQALVICVVFQVDEDSFAAEALIVYDIDVDDECEISFLNLFGRSKSEYMWLIRTAPLRFRSSHVNGRHNIKVRFKVSGVKDNATVSIRSHGVYVVEEHQLHPIQTLTYDVTEEEKRDDVKDEERGSRNHKKPWRLCCGWA